MKLSGLHKSMVNSVDETLSEMKKRLEKDYNFEKKEQAKLKSEGAQGLMNLGGAALGDFTNNLEFGMNIQKFHHEY
jgi:hypothetical protein